jgi:hypothetical protein
VNIEDQIPSVDVTFKDGKLASMERKIAPASEVVSPDGDEPAPPADVDKPPLPEVPEVPKPSLYDDGKKVVKSLWERLFGRGGKPSRTAPLNDGSRGNSEVNQGFGSSTSTIGARRSRVQELWERWVWN